MDYDDREEGAPDTQRESDEDEVRKVERDIEKRAREADEEEVQRVERDIEETVEETGDDQ